MGAPLSRAVRSFFFDLRKEKHGTDRVGGCTAALERWNDVHRTFPEHQMLGYGERVQAAAYERMDQVLLLQIKGDVGLGWHSNNGCALQFWIRPEQLAESAFDTVDLTLECD